ncbi:hypothetical protein A2291_07295 [candidate division WOR-1 bacterium RIFOXYB2_FULL_42_35]|uniref:AAA+ ATPase domain-containing protein n=1 Tax=candidate division WOR-1 bacterium RIFOXYC2_FULL_41_25 TaxID=1802586 RepID=A0A1F4TKZ2_UNCSA|nr:MAG: hypothetical protein A2291_07295 [candidate division WOR-1 bacterium RIFOXYB2_FULL_42_35]OGC25591.1 MAG: hypothetical protein A2247_01595 [candidate division WOR-1 bacterium RIFOXYA2_FULL_41_14]OGC33249.1 MAG: hypothetical protein A2462_07470 [candidate division WOR-1 bacterium RIFOXYC2_FULL_41_25]OGC43367.1 MAG: hypothetical protein A2548_00060 [candidate division WOR-1 bacterium RIFOXYD2_FULL_41_8]
MFDRKIEKQLQEWKDRHSRKPLILRGARQTGKTTIIRKFSSSFKVFIELNLEKDSIKRLFQEIKDISLLIQSIEAVVNQKIIPGETLLFLDEIQNSPNAIKLLRYFHEELPALHVVGAGSLLEVRMKKEGWSFPVGRVEFLYLYPVNFEEFLLALKEKIVIEYLLAYKLPTAVPAAINDKLVNLLADYMIVGGMPEAVKEYLDSRSFVAVRKKQEALVQSFREDFVKYSSPSEVEYLKLLWDKIPFEIGARLNYSRLAGGNAKSRNIANAFDIMHEAMLVERIFPTTAITLPLVKKNKSAPKAVFLDIGLCTHALNLTRDQVKEKVINPTYVGGLLEAFVGQELLAGNPYDRSQLYFWLREEKGSVAELDFVLQPGSELLPVEIKAGSQGSLKSLHQFLAKSKKKVGIRVYNGEPEFREFAVNLSTGQAIKYSLLSLPAYLIFRLVDLYRESCCHEN